MTLPDGSVKLSTKFTRLTGRSPILLAGMTPTTVDAKIVAAAANAGHWAELAGGGQVTEEIFDDRIAELTATARARPCGPVQLAVPRPVPVEAAGRRQAVGAEGPSVRRADRRRRGQRRYPRPRRSRRADRGAQQRRHQPCGVQAGHRRADPLGHPHRGRGAQQAGDRAHRGRPRRWPPLLGGPRRPAAGHLLRAAQAAQHHRLRRRRYRHPGAGGRVPVRPLGRGLRLPAMPVDGILVGTAAMATLESTTSPSVKQMLVETTGTEQWISAGKAAGRHGFQPQPARRRHPRDRQRRLALRPAARRGRR